MHEKRASPAATPGVEMCLQLEALLRALFAPLLEKIMLLPEKHPEIEPVPVRGKLKHILFYALIISLSAFPLGWDLGTAGNWMDLPAFRARVGIQSKTTGLIISMFNLGSICGCAVLLLSSATQRIGHLALLRWGLCVYLFGTALLLVHLFVPHAKLFVFLVGRLFCGGACGALAVVAPVYIGHLATFVIAGSRMLLVNQVMVSVFMLAGNGVFLLSLGEKVLVIVQFVVPAIAIGALFYLPHSPRDDIIQREPPVLRRTINSLVQSSERDSVYRSTVKLLVQMKDSEKAKEVKVRDQAALLATCCTIMVLQQLTGINCFFYFGKVLFDQILDTPAVKLLALFLGLCNLVGTLCSVYVVYLLGTKKCLIIGLSSLTALMVIFASMGLKASRSSSDIFALGYAMLVLTCIFLFVFAVSWGPCASVYCLELLANNDKLMHYVVMTGSLANVVVTSVIPILVDAIGYGTMLVFALCTGSLVWFLWGTRAE